HLERGVLWDAALRMVAAHPVFGVGAGNFRIVLGNYLGFAVWDNRLHANNTYLEMFADSGLLGGAAFMLLVLLVLRHAMHALQHAQRTADVCWTAAVAGALGAFLIHDVVDYFLEFTSIYFMFWMTLGVLSALADPQRRNG
ncbi:MAG: O-antigen ligase family protein, partial [Chloroflexi bacterium]|nr:O-antigen ligase family protein [Chloroflexota bacterium]